MTDTVFELDTSFNVEATVESISPVRHLVIVVHGIFDNSSWSQSFQAKAEFNDVDIKIRPVSYELTGLFSLLTGFREKSRVNEISYRIFENIKRNEFEYLTIICHSYGSKLFSLLDDELKEKFDYVFLGGSICHLNDDSKFYACKNYVINDCGINDIWPSVAAAVKPRRFGNTGVVGFNNEPFRDRYFRAGHSLITGQAHFLEYVVPALTTGHVKNSYLDTGKCRLFLPRVIRAILLLAVLLIGRWLFF